MAEYRYATTGGGVIRTADGAFIPNDPGNKDWIAFAQWRAQGGVPDEAQGAAGWAITAGYNRRRRHLARLADLDPIAAIGKILEGVL